MAISKNEYTVPDRASLPRKLEPHQLLLDPDAVAKLCEVVRTTDVSRAVRIAIDRVLAADEVRVERARIEAHGDNRYTPPPMLPVYLSPEDVIEPWDDEDPSG
jgi:hypothetical protein